MIDTDLEISFLPSTNARRLPEKAILGAMGFLGLNGFAPAGSWEETHLFRGMTSLTVASDWVLAEPVLGAPMAVMALEELSRRGVRELIFLGLAGSLTPEMMPGDLWCPQSGLSTEGTSTHYPVSSLEPDNELYERICGAGAQMGLSIHTGLHWSTDGFYRETAGIVERHRNAGALGVDMECTALWAAARFRRIKMAAIMVISDLLHDGRHHLGFDLPEFNLGLQQAAGLAWKVLK